MGKQEIQKLIDEEKPGFDYARMFLTTVAWWTVLIFVASAILGKPVTMTWAIWVLAPLWLVGALFGIYLAFRLNFLTERISDDLLDGAAGMPVWLRWPFRLVVAMMPLACSSIVVWALLFANLGTAR